MKPLESKPLRCCLIIPNSLQLLQNDNITDIGLSSSRLDYLWRVGLFDVSDGLDTLSTNAIAATNKVLNTVLLLQIIGLIVSAVLTGYYLLFMVRALIICPILS